MITKTQPKQKAQSDEIREKEIHKDSVSKMNELNASLMEAFCDVSAEMAKFIAQRIAEDVKVQHALLHSKDIKEIQSIQTSFFEQAIKQYQEGAVHMFDIATHALKERGPG